MIKSKTFFVDDSKLQVVIEKLEMMQERLTRISYLVLPDSPMKRDTRE